MLMSDHAWLWARGYDGGGPHTSLLRRRAHWLMKEPDLEEERLLATAKGLTLTIERRSMEKTVQPVSIQGPDGKKTTIILEAAKDGIWRSSVGVKIPGLYKFQTGKLTAVAHAGIADQREMSQVTATPDKLTPILDGTGGGSFWTRTGGLLESANTADVSLPRVSLLNATHVLHGSDWLGLRDRQAYVTRGIKLIPMFDGLLALAALLALLTLTWWREGR